MSRTQTRPTTTAYHAGSEVAGPIVVATKGQGRWSSALEAAHLLAARDGGEVQVLAVLRPLAGTVLPYGVEPPPAALEDCREATVLEALTEQVRRVPHAGTWRVEVALGSPARTLAAVARERRARLLIMGLGRHTPVDRVLGAETTLHTLRHADCPVLAVGAEMSHLPHSGVAGVDFSPASAWAAERALGLLDNGGTLTLMHVRSRSELSQPVWKAWDAAYVRRVTELFERLVRTLEPRAARAGVRLEIETRSGDPADELLAFADANDVDLIAVGSSGAGFVERLLVGSVATAVLRRATCCVLACPRPPLADEERIGRALTGTVESLRPDEWAALLDAVTERNLGRPTTLEVDDPALGTRGQEIGLTFLGAAFDRHDRRLEIMLGDAVVRTRHLTRNVPGVSALAVQSSADGRDRTLRVENGRGRTLLTFHG